MRTRTFRKAAVAAALALSALACKDVLDVELPGKVTEEALNNPVNAAVLTNG
ncbi:MAG: hypothetical protein JNJ98_07140, partial [Gemmatimonadetes bacterium]|nr:hypothetical protein [Gemmatimonadota bacterium]